MKNNFVYPSDIGLHKFPSGFTVNENKYKTVEDCYAAWLYGLYGEDVVVYNKFKEYINESAQKLVDKWYRRNYSLRTPHRR